MNKKILGFIIDSLQNNEPIVLITTVESTGHSPGQSGFSMAVTKDEIIGTIGGGAIEKNMVNTARKMLAKNGLLPEIFHRVHRVSANKLSSGMICGGSQTIVMHPIQKIDLETFQKCIDSFSSKGAPKTLCLSDTGIQCIEKRSSAPYSFSNFRDHCWSYEEMLGQKNTAYIFGGGHVALALSPILASLGFCIVILDERPSINTIRKNTFINELHISPFKTLPNIITEGENSYAFIMTPSHTHDETVLCGLLGKNLKYLGMMASKTKVTEIFARLENKGFTKEQLAKVHAPIGLSIHSHTAEEIAVSISAEVIRVKNSG
jgi:xanthine dehydrogenase accessory factor